MISVIKETEQHQEHWEFWVRVLCLIFKQRGQERPTEEVTVEGRWP